MSRGRLIVMKFGGTSVGDAARFRQCAEIVAQAARNDRVIVVVSAMAGVTDLILKTIDAAKHGDSAATEAGVKKLEAVHETLIHELFSQPQSGSVLEFANGIFEQFRNSCRALLALRSDVSAQTQDLLAALGERISAWVLSQYIQHTGTASEFVPVESAIITDNNFGNAAPDMAATSAACRSTLFSILDRGAIPVVPGYSGATKSGQPTTLGRGGSD